MTTTLCYNCLSCSAIEMTPPSTDLTVHSLESRYSKDIDQKPVEIISGCISVK